MKRPDHTVLMERCISHQPAPIEGWTRHTLRVWRETSYGHIEDVTQYVVRRNGEPCPSVCCLHPISQTVRIYGFYFVYVMGAGVICGVQS